MRKSEKETHIRVCPRNTTNLNLNTTLPETTSDTGGQVPEAGRVSLMMLPTARTGTTTPPRGQKRAKPISTKPNHLADLDTTSSENSKQ